MDLAGTKGSCKVACPNTQRHRMCICVRVCSSVNVMGTWLDDVTTMEGVWTNFCSWELIVWYLICSFYLILASQCWTKQRHFSRDHHVLKFGQKSSLNALGDVNTMLPLNQRAELWATALSLHVDPITARIKKLKMNSSRLCRQLLLDYSDAENLIIYRHESLILSRSMSVNPNGRQK